MPTWVSVLISMAGFVLGGGFLGFLQYMINRHDEKKGKRSATLEAIKALEAKIDSQVKDMDDRFSAIESRMDSENATDARIRILRFSDEIMHGVRHSEESFNQCLQDITLYEKYCGKHPDYKNARAKVAIANVQSVYERCVRESDFLR